MEESLFGYGGLIYVPTDCESETESCRIVFALHGCEGNAQSVMDSWGLNDFASTNKLIIVYPESDCWDNHGDVDSDHYLTRDGLYPRVFMNMIAKMTDPEFLNDDFAMIGRSVMALGCLAAFLSF